MDTVNKQLDAVPFDEEIGSGDPSVEVPDTEDTRGVEETATVDG